MKKFEGILICTDLDGTLFSSDKTVSRENVEAIEYFKSEGGFFTFITGRMPYFSMSAFDAVRPNAPFGCINGGGIFDGDALKYVSTYDIDPSVTELVRYADENIGGLGIQLNTYERVYFCRDNAAMERFRRLTGVPLFVKDYEGFDEPIAKVLFGDEDPEKLTRLDKLLRSHPRAEEFDFIRSERTLFEILPKGISKATALLGLDEHLGILRERTIAVGDYDNDITMLEAAGLGIAVENATENAKRAADLITVSNDESAIARIIRDIDCGKIRI